MTDRRLPRHKRLRESCGLTPSRLTWTARGATPTCWCGTARCGPSTAGPHWYFHHSWPNRGSDPARFAGQPFDASKHVLLDVADDLSPMHDDLADIVLAALLDGALAQVPDEWLEPTDAMPDAEAVRTAYRLSLLARLDNPSGWLPRMGSS